MTSENDRDIDELIHDEYEQALEHDAPWALESLRYREWAALHGKTVHAVFAEDDGPSDVWGVWEWHGQRAEDFYLVKINDPAGNLIVGTDPRNFRSVTVVPAHIRENQGAEGDR